MPGLPVESEHRFTRDESAVYVKTEGVGRSRPLHRLTLETGRWREVWRDAPDGTTLSPDETRVAGVRNDRQRARSHLVVADARGGFERTVATRSLDSPFQSPVWSPNGRTLAVTVGTNGFGGRPVGVVEVDVATGRERPIGPQDWLYALAKTWLPDGQALLLVGRRRDDAETTPSLYRLGRASGAIRRLSLGGLRPSGNLSLSADGRTLVINAVRFRAGLWLLPYGDSTRAREVALAQRAPRFLPDGSIVYTGVDDHLWILQPGGRTRQVARHAYEGTPIPGGRGLLVTLVRNGVPHVFRTDRDGRIPVRLSHAPAGDTAVAPDGSYALYVTAGDARLWKVPLGGGSPILLSHRPAAFPAISPDGHWVAAIEPDHNPPRVRIMAATGGDERVLPLPWGAAQSPGSFRFSPDGTALDFVRTDDRGVGNVWGIPLEGGPAVQLTQFRDEELTAFDWSWDGRSLVCLRGGWYGDAYVVRGDW
jgi:Tol biopolymer transport system component